jgi:outer membrane lipoprotein-sorting protein
MMRTIFSACFSLIAVAASVNGQTLSLGEIKKLLARVHEKRVASPNVQADFQEEKASHFLDKPLISTGKVWFQAPNKFRREMKGSSQTVAVSNGHDFWIHFPNTKSTQHFRLGKNSPVDAALAAMNTALNLENVESTYQITGTKADGGYELQLLPRTPAGKRIFQRFNLRLSGDLFVQRTEMLKPNGDKVVTTYSNQSRTAIPAATFEFTPPPGTTISNPLGR